VAVYVDGYEQFVLFPEQYMGQRGFWREIVMTWIAWGSINR